jgi:hypothetical protein
MKFLHRIQQATVVGRVFIGDWLLRNLFLDKPARTALGLLG